MVNAKAVMDPTFSTCIAVQPLWQRPHTDHNGRADPDTPNSD